MAEQSGYAVRDSLNAEAQIEMHAYIMLVWRIAQADMYLHVYMHLLFPLKETTEIKATEYNI